MIVVSDFYLNDPPTGSNQPHGIIYTIRNKVTDNEILSYVEPTLHEKYYGSEEVLIKWTQYDFCQTVEDEGSYVQIEFKKGYVFPTFYSFKGSGSHGYISKEWDLYGLTSFDGKLELIASNTSESSTFCYPYYGNCRCGNENWGTFAIHDAKKSYKYFRIIAKNPLKAGHHAVELSGFEIFGYYSKYGTSGNKIPKTYCFRSYPISRHIPFYLVVRYCLTIDIISY